MNLTESTKVPWPTARAYTVNRKYGPFRHDRKPITMREAKRRVSAQVGGFTKSGRTWRTNELAIYADEKFCPVVVRFDLDTKEFLIPCDAFNQPAQNLAAIAAYIEGLRAQERYGVASLTEMLTSFEALPPRTIVRAWFDVLGVQENAPMEIVQAAYKALVQKHHPDKGGSREKWDELQRAWTEAQEADRG